MAIGVLIFIDLKKFIKISCFVQIKKFFSGWCVYFLIKNKSYWLFKLIALLPVEPKGMKEAVQLSQIIFLINLKLLIYILL